MSERKQLVESIAKTAKDYRIPPTPDRVEKWISQFDSEAQLPILRELDHVLSKTYFSRERVIASLQGMLSTEKLAGADPSAFWGSVSFLSIQARGASQEDMLGLLDAPLKTLCGKGWKDCGFKTPSLFVYIAGRNVGIEGQRRRLRAYRTAPSRS